MTNPCADKLQAQPLPGRGLALEELPTPCLLVDEARFEHNAERMARHWRESGVVLRPHLKTCRCWPLALRAMASAEGPCTVATMGEAEAAALLGARDIVLAVGIRPGLLARARALMAMGVRLHVLLDSLAMARTLVADAAEHKVRYSVLLEIDCDGHRAGLAADDARLVEIAGLLAGQGQEVAGVLTHAGSAYDLVSPEAIRRLADREAAQAVIAAGLLRRAGHAAPVVSVGSTPTALLGRGGPSVTEVRAGVYLFMDLVMEGLGVCRLEDLALSVLASVLSGFPEGENLPGKIITDAGWAALSSDRGLARRFADQGFGLVCDIDGQLLPGLRVADLNQEHGMLQVADAVSDRVADVLRSLTPASRLRILPNHACATAMMHDHYYLVRDNRAVAVLPRFGGW